MPDRSCLAWPFFDEQHRRFARELDAWAAAELAEPAHGDDVDAACRRLVRRYGESGWLKHVVAGPDGASLDVRTLCLARDVLARHHGLADFAFAMQGLGSGAISLFGTGAQRAQYLERVSRGEAIAAFALTEPEAGSDVTAMRTTARADGGDWVLDGEKTWISNGGIADFYVVFARLPGDGARRFGAFVVDADAPGFGVAERIDTIAPHPLARITLNECRVSGSAMIGEPGRGLRVALGTLDVFRPTVGAAALGFARRALDETLAHVRSRRVSGGTLADLQLTQARLAGMATDIDASALLVYRAAWARDAGAARITRESAMAKWYATEAAQRVIDAAVQLHGGRGVRSGEVVERLYREVRSLRIYEGASEVQQLVIARQLLESPTGIGPNPS
jgi:acyl-CoA dehydrogenase